MQIYDDNLYNDEDDQIDELISRFMPSLALEYQAPRLELDLAYTLDYRVYAMGERGDEDVHFLEAISLLNWKEFAYLEILDRYSRVSLDSKRDYREESLFANQSNQNLFSISPYLQLRPTARTSLKAGYQYVNIYYEEERGQDKEHHIAFLEGSRELTDRLVARAGYKYVDENVKDSTTEIDNDRHDLWTGLRYQLGENSYLFGTIGYSWISFADGAGKDDLFWDFGASHDFRLLVATASLGVRYVEDPEGSILREENYRLALHRDWDRGRLAASASYAEFYDPQLDLLDTRRYGGSASFIRELTERLNGTATFSAFRYEEEIDDTWTRRLIGSLGLAYQASRDVTASLTYYRIDSHSPQLPEDRYETNRIFLELKKVF
ncbi:MAG: TIGR03016 family PEP-CTERM system-associated outer membrane protein [Desulfuromonadales bacterium]|nr:TIGR03016 family PEP-CTERM system-associated outer membrane protein [Desulfuromonadales bacterium]